MFRNLNAEQARFAMTNADVAEMLGISRQAYETKKTTGKFTLSEIRKLCKKFECTFEYLFETEGEV